MSGMRAKMQAAVSVSLPVEVVLTGAQENRIVDAILAVMREPTEEMKKAKAVGFNMSEPEYPLDGYLDDIDAKGVWQGMIDNIIQEPTT